MSDTLKITYENDDGYAGGSRPHHITLYKDDYDIHVSETRKIAELMEMLREDFQDNHLNLYTSDLQKFLEWVSK
jgi:hypothetical protein